LVFPWLVVKVEEHDKQWFGQRSSEAMFERFPCANDKLYAKMMSNSRRYRCIISIGKAVFFHDAIC
jgi:hypothetical protein